GEGWVQVAAPEALRGFEVAVAELLGGLDLGPFAPIVPGGQLDDARAALQRTFERLCVGPPVAVLDAAPRLVDPCLFVAVVEAREGGRNEPVPGCGAGVEIIYFAQRLLGAAGGLRPVEGAGGGGTA